MILTNWRAQVRDGPDSAWRTIVTHEDPCEVRKRLLHELVQHAQRALDSSDFQTAVASYVARERVNAGAHQVVVDRSTYRVLPPGPVLPYALTPGEADDLIRLAVSLLTSASTDDDTGRCTDEIDRSYPYQKAITPDLEHLGRTVYARIHSGADDQPNAATDAREEATVEATLIPFCHCVSDDPDHFTHWSDCRFYGHDGRENQRQAELDAGIDTAGQPGVEAARVNLHKHRCRSYKCTMTANYLSHDGFCGYYLCTFHAERNQRRMGRWQRDHVVLIPIAQTHCDDTDADHTS